MAIILIVGFVVAVVVNYYLWNWIAPVFGWPEISFWWCVLITLVFVPIKLFIEGVFYFLVCGEDS